MENKGIWIFKYFITVKSFIIWEKNNYKKKRNEVLRFTGKKDNMWNMGR